MPVSYNDVMQNPSAYKFLGPGAGYAYLGAPPLPNPPAAPASIAEPPGNTLDRTWHILRSPGNDAEIRMQWIKALKVWIPQNQMISNRVGFTSAYLAGSGWSYLGELDD